MILHDKRIPTIIGDYEKPEDAVKVVGELMTLYGVQYAKGRFMLTENPDKRGRANIVYDDEEIIRRGLVYYDHMEQRKRRGF